jgi:hypothetical protein
MQYVYRQSGDETRLVCCDDDGVDHPVALDVSALSESDREGIQTELNTLLGMTGF